MLLRTQCAQTRRLTPPPWHYYQMHHLIPLSRELRQIYYRHSLQTGSFLIKYCILLLPTKQPTPTGATFHWR